MYTCLTASRLTGVLRRRNLMPKLDPRTLWASPFPADSTRPAHHGQSWNTQALAACPGWWLPMWPQSSPGQEEAVAAHETHRYPGRFSVHGGPVLLAIASCCLLPVIKEKRQCHHEFGALGRLRLERNLWSALGWPQHISTCRAESWALIWVPWCDFDHFSSLGLRFISSTFHGLLDLCGGQELRAHLPRLSPSNWIPQKAFGKSWTALTSLKKAPGQHLPKDMWYEPHLLL